MFRPIVLPAKRDYYMDKLKENNLDEYYMVEQVLEYVGEEYRGTMGLIFFYGKKLIDFGWVQPTITDKDGDYATLKFLLWNFLTGEYMAVDVMDEGDYEIYQGLLERMFDVN